MKNISFLLHNGETKFKCDYLTRRYLQMGRSLVRAARKYLDKEGKNASGKLRKSVRFYFEVVKETIVFGFKFEGADYWQYVEYGVGGAIGGSQNKAPDSPFRFGTNSGRVNGLRSGIDRWVIQKKLPGFRDAKGRFIPRKQAVSTISRKIYLYGIEPTPFASDSLDVVFKKNKKNIETAFNNDVEAYLGKQFEEKINITISI